MYYFDPYYFLLVVPALLLGLWAQSRVQSTYRKYSQVHGSRGYTGQQAARYILDQNGLQHVRIEPIAGNLTDHFDPRSNTVCLSEGVYHSTSIAAVGIAAHECGHAVQHSTHYAPLKVRSAIIPVTNIGTKAAVPLLLIGLVLNVYPLILIGLIGYSLIAVFQLVTLPVEYNASRRAMAVISNAWLLDEEEQAGAKKVLSAAALTYVAALVSSLAQLLRMVLLYGGRGRRRD
ncbi:zinc metallopeptidase [Ruminococcaceae bacterium OttesenSCG-928-L11]|nr:zinc metallopeptidase [Ruminococcaceae bacterium OttesenSCG-928-L11]